MNSLRYIKFCRKLGILVAAAGIGTVALISAALSLGTFERIPFVICGLAFICLSFYLVGSNIIRHAIDEKFNSLLDGEWRAIPVEIRIELSRCRLVIRRNAAPISEIHEAIRWILNFNEPDATK